MIVTAIDGDVGSDAQIEYELLTDTDTFWIVPQSGVVRVIKPLEFDVDQGNYQIRIRAQETGTRHQYYAETTVEVEVMDVPEK